MPTDHLRSLCSRAAGQARAQSRVVPANLAVFEGADVPVDLLQAFVAVIIDPASGFDPTAHPLQHTVWIAGTHTPAAGGTPDSFVAQQIEPLWQRGYRGSLLDTPSALASLDAIHAAHPDARLAVGGEHALQAALPHAAALPTRHRQEDLCGGRRAVCDGWGVENGRCRRRYGLQRWATRPAIRKPRNDGGIAPPRHLLAV
jgi:hypothetical protein